MSRACLILASAVLSTACATYANTPQAPVYGAMLSETPNSQTRDLIHTYIRDTLGSDYSVNTEDLVTSNTLTATDRGRGQVSGRPIPKPDVMFKLELAEMTEGPVCRLVPQSYAPDAPVLLLPPEVVCTLMPS